MPSVLITGGTRGIGLALCGAFARAGWKVVTCWHEDGASAEAARRGLSGLPDEVLVEKADVTREGEVADLVEKALGAFGSLECAVHNAGANWNARILNTTEESWDDTIAVHLQGAFNVSRAVLKPMVKARDGHLVFLSSVVATTGNIGQGSYTAAKAGVLGFMRSLAAEYGGRNIRSNAVCPGFHPTRLADDLTPEAQEAIRKRHLLGRAADLKETVEFMVWLAGTQNISGQVFNLDSRLPGWL